MSLVGANALYSYTPGLDDGADGALNTIIEQCEPYLARLLGWRETTVGQSASWDSAARTFYLDGPSVTDPRMLQLPVKPVTAITSIHDDALWGYGSAYLVASGDYTLVGEDGQVWIDPDGGHAWSTGKRNLKVICTAGYSTATAPESLKEAILRYCAHVYTLRKGGHGRRTASAGGNSATFDLPPVPDDVRRMLLPFRCPSQWLS